MIELLDVVVDDDDRVVDDNAKGDDEPSEGHLVQLDADGAENRYGDRDRDGNRHCGYCRNAQWEQEHGYENHRRKRDEKLASELDHAMLYVRRLIGDRLNDQIWR